MESIRIKNLRSIVDSGDIQLSRINILLGRNSSGKSSFIRLFPLLKETSRHELRGPILWFDENYDFGDFSNTLSRHAEGEKEVISIEFTWNIEFKGRRSPYFVVPTTKESSRTKGKEKAQVEIGISKYNDSTYFKKIRIVIWGNEIVIENDSPHKPVSLTLNNRKVAQSNYKWNYGSEGILPDLALQSNITPIDIITASLIKLYGENSIKTEDYYLMTRVPLFDEDAIWDFISEVILKQKKSILTKTIKDTDEYRRIVDTVIWASLPRLIDYIDDELSEYFYHTYYVTPLRYNFLRYMRNRELAVEYVESTGKNVMEYILSLNEEERLSYIEYISKTLEIIIDVTGQDNKSIFVTTEDGERDNIVDVGYGISQVLPIATILWDRAYKKDRYPANTIVVEQPEVHLHPAMQKKLARLFVEALNIAKSRGRKLTLIIETHSNALVNRLGAYVQNDNAPKIPELLEYYQLDKESEVKISNEDISVYLFDKKEGVTHITKTSYDKSGRIVRWPIGFLD